MDPSQLKDDSQNTDFKISSAEEACIYLEGSHTTSTETEASFRADKKNVKFEDDHENEKKVVKEKQSSDLKEEAAKIKEKQLLETEESLSMVRVTKDFFMTEKPMQQTEARELRNEKPQETTFMGGVTLKNLSEQQEQQHKMQNISSERKEISHRLEKIIDMFDSLSKNLETLDIKVKPKTVKTETALDKNNKKSSKNEWIKDEVPELEQPQKEQNSFEKNSLKYQIKTDTDVYQGETKFAQLSSILVTHTTSAVEIELIEDYLKQQKMALRDLENEANTMKATQASSISTATSNCELKSFACQTQFSDHNILSNVDLIEVSSLASRSEEPNSLNNYAQAENACVPYYGSQYEISKQPPIIPQPLTTPAVIVQEAPAAQHYSVITIQANPTPSSIDLRRPPFWQRLWEVIGDFCAATILCLQVNRDCIFCLGFTVAFVVSASFLTAFFYHTLTLWQTEDSAQF